MKKIRGFFIAVFLFPAGVVFAQFGKGDRMVGASVGSIVINSGNADITVTSIGSNTSRITSYAVTIQPSMGWFLSEKTALGASLNINPTGNKTTYEQNGSTYQSDKVNGTNFGLGGFVRQYLGHSGSLLPFGQLSLNGGLSNLKTEGFFYGGSGANAYKLTYDGNSTSGSFFNATLTAGFTKMVGSYTGLDFYIGYTYSHNKNTFKRTSRRDNGNDGSVDETLENETTTTFNNHGFQMGAGFQVFLKKKK